MMLDEEVIAAIMALVIAGSVIATIHMLNLSPFTHFESISLLNANCTIDGYPEEIRPGSNVSFCILVHNDMGEAQYYKIVVKYGSNSTLPTREAPSPSPVVRDLRVVIPPGGNITIKVKIPFNPPEGLIANGRVALIFELWRYNVEKEEWEFTGKWVHIYVKPAGGTSTT